MKRKHEVKEGDKYSRLTLISELEEKSTHVKWLCKCECGNFCTPRLCSIISGNSRSCGCYRREQQLKSCTKHSMSGSKEYNIWFGMKERCYNEKKDHYDRYGGRGIIVCDRWLESFDNFFLDMGFCPENMSLDRVDVNGNYEPSNCVWATKQQQAYNTNLRVTNKSGKSGVHFNKNEQIWEAAITVKYKKIHLGKFVNFEDAVVARQKAELEYYGKIKE